MNIEASKWPERRVDTTVIVDESAAARRRKRNLILAAGAVVLLAIAAFLFMSSGSGTEKAAPPAKGAGRGGESLPPVTVIVPGRQQVSGVITATGSLAARRDMPVGVPGEGGQIVRVLVEPGQWVRAGQTLAVIDRSVQNQEAQQLAAQIDVFRADLAVAETELQRARALVSRGFVSQADVQRKTATRDAAAARVRVAQAQLGQARARIGRLDVRAPASGLVLDRNVEAGQVVSAGSGALFRIAQNGEMELLARMSQQDLSRLRPGVPATVTPVGSARSYQGAVWQVSPIIDPQSRQGEARISIPYDPALRPGGFASAEIVSGSIAAPLLPESAVHSDEQGTYVLIVGADDSVARRAVRVAEVTDRGVVVAEGLNGTERVVMSAGAFLTPGQKVRPQLAVVR
ncbi:efflux RND transporter periplasmic adaptor subunit [Allosphingosinicella sp.]|uniref:efflux RND transporter periplasmic adaptor subunit n=1 Tax=Allosphingosinicella sp. TaxID=2823234 RepID=UPI002F110C20